MNKILVPTDFSSYAMDAARLAVDLAKKWKASVHFVHLVGLPQGWDAMDSRERGKHPGSLALLATIEDELKKLQSAFDGEGVEVTVRYTNSPLGSGFKHLMDDPTIDLIVMGSHGTTGSAIQPMGSNAQRVVRSAKCPVIVIKEPLDSAYFKNIIFASNFNIEARKAFSIIVAFAKMFGSVIHLLTINAPSFFQSPRFITRLSMAEFTKLAEGVPCTIHDVSDIGVEEGIIRFADDINADLIAIGTYGRNAVSRIFVGSIAEALVNHVQMPVMTINIHD